MRIYSEDIKIEFGKENSDMLMMEGIELPNLEKIRTLGEKEAYKYLGILDADTIENAEMKEKISNTSVERENWSKLNYVVETSSKGWTPGLSPL